MSLATSANATVVRLADSSSVDPSQASFAFPSGADFSNGTVVPVQQASDSSAKVTLPGTVAAGIFAVQFNTPGAAGNIQAVVNVPQIKWWMGRSSAPGSTGSLAYAGQNLAVYGRNMGTAPSAWLSLNASFTPLTVKQSNPYQVLLGLPSSLAPGTYQLWIHNGYGGKYGFSAPATVTVAQAPAAWPNTVFNVMNFGAKGDGSTDDTAAVKAALAQARNSGGGTVYLPAGNYLVSGKLSIPANTTVAGDSSTASNIITPSVTLSTGTFPALFAGNQHFIIQDLSISTNAADFLITCPDVGGMYNHYGIPQPLGATCTDVRVRRVAITHTTRQPLLSNGSYKGTRTFGFVGSDIQIVDSTVTTHNLSAAILQNLVNALIAGNKFENGRLSTVSLANSQRSVIENNEIAATAPEGTCLNNQGSIHFMYFAGNYIHDCGGTFGEGLTEDTPYFPYRLSQPDSINAADGTLSYSASLVDPNPAVPAGSKLDLTQGYIAVVVGGTGVGQMKEIVANTLTQVSVASPWQVPLDATSVIDLQVDKSDDVFYQNEFSNTSVAIQLYSQAYANVIDGTTGNNTGGSYCIANDFPSQAKSNGPWLRRFEYCYYNEWINNSFAGNLPDSNINKPNQLPYRNAFLGQAGSARTMTDMPSTVTPTAPLIMFIGNSVRDNQLNDNNSLGFIYDELMSHATVVKPSLDSELSRDFLVEGNGVQNCAPAQGDANASTVGIDIYAGAFGTVLNSNQVAGCATPVWNSSQP